MKPQQLKQLIREEVIKIAKSITKHNLNEADVNWKEFYTMAKDTSGHNPNFEKKYGNLMDRPHIADALKKARDFNSFLKAVKQFESVNGVIKESTENFIGAALVKKSGMVKDLDSLEKEPIYVRDVLPIYRKEGSSYVVKSLMTGNALKVPAANLIVKMKDQFEPDKWAKFMAKMTRY